MQDEKRSSVESWYFLHNIAITNFNDNFLFYTEKVYRYFSYGSYTMLTICAQILLNQR